MAKLKWTRAEDTRERVHPREISQVESRVGTTPAARLQWALNLAQLELADLTSFDLENLRRELVAFDCWVIPHDQVWSRRVPKALAQAARHPDLHPDAPVPLPSLAEVRQTQRAVWNVVRTLLDSGEVQIGPMRASFVIFRDPKGRWEYFYRNPGTHSWGGFTFANLLGGLASLVRECPEPKCRRWFVASRANQWYCSTRCQTRATTRAHRQGKVPRRRAASTEEQAKAQRAPGSRRVV